MPEQDGLQYHGRRSDGRHVWRVRPYVGTPRRRVTATFDTPTKSWTAARRKRADVVRRLEADASLVDAARPTVGRLLDDWLARTGTTKSPRTMQGYRARADIIRKRFGTTIARDLDTDTIDAWYHTLRTSGTTEASLLEIHRVFSAALRWAYKMRRISEVPTDFVDKPKHRPPKITPPTPDMMRRLLSGLPDAEWARAVALLAFGGMRRGEVVGLRWEDLTAPELVETDAGVEMATAPMAWVRHSVVEITGKPVHVQPYPKSREHRHIELPLAAWAVLEQQRAYLAGARAVSPWVFPDWDSWRLSKPRRPGSLSISWGRYRKRHDGCERVRLHDLRHFYATAAMASGADMKAIAEQLGHTDVATTIRIYVHSTDAGRRAVVDAVGRALEAGENDE